MSTTTRTTPIPATQVRDGDTILLGGQEMSVSYAVPSSDYPGLTMLIVYTPGNLHSTTIIRLDNWYKVQRVDTVPLYPVGTIARSKALGTVHVKEDDDTWKSIYGTESSDEAITTWLADGYGEVVYTPKEN